MSEPGHEAPDSEVRFSVRLADWRSVGLRAREARGRKMEAAPIKHALVDINEILKTLPHRYPMLLIDRVIDIRTDHSGIGIKNVTYNETVFLGHFPDRPVYPGVLMIEAMAQTAGVIGIKAMETEK